MITKTSLKSRRYLARVRRAAINAVKLAHAFKSGICAFPVTNCRGDLSLYAIGRVGGSIEFHDAHDNDVSGIVLEALRDFHANLPGEITYPRVGR
ncbi:MAG: hypothetical protein ACREA9_21060 [Pyrinomonadaceae bacterium]